MTDESGDDAKVLSVPIDKLSRLYRGVQDFRDMPEILLEAGVGGVAGARDLDVHAKGFDEVIGHDPGLDHEAVELDGRIEAQVFTHPAQGVDVDAGDLRSACGSLAALAPRAAAALETLVPVDVAGIAPGRQRYAMFTDETGAYSAGTWLRLPRGNVIWRAMLLARRWFSAALRDCRCIWSCPGAF